MQAARSALVFWLLLATATVAWAQSALEIRGRLVTARQLLQDQKIEEALKLLQTGLEELRALDHQDTPLGADFSLALGRTYRVLNDEAKAVESFERAIAILEPLGEEEKPRLRQALGEYGEQQRGSGNNERALELYLQALALEPTDSPAGQLGAAKLLHNLACIYRDLGQLDRAYEVFSEALLRKESLLSGSDPSLAITLSEFGGVCRLMGRFVLAERYLERALEIRRADKQASLASYARVLNNLSLVKQATGKNREALSLLKESLEIAFQLHGADHPETMVPQMNLAQVAWSLGDFEEAERLLTLAMATAYQNFGPDSLQVATVQHNLGGLMLDVADLQKAQAYLETALRVRRERLSPTHQELLPTLINLGSVHRLSGRDDQALAFYQEALAVGRACLGDEHPDLAYTLDMMARVPSLADRPEQVQKLTEQAYEIRRKAYGPRAAATAYSTYSLGILSHQRGDLLKAEEQLTSSLETFRSELGPEHPYVGKAAYRLGLLALDRKQPGEALNFARQQAESSLATTQEVFSFASERQRLAYAAQFKPYDLLASLGAAEELAAEVLRYKGAVLDSMMEDLSLARVSSDSAVQSRVQELLEVREQLSSLKGDPTQHPKGSDPASSRQRVNELSERLDKLESALARDGHLGSERRRAFRISPAEVSRALPPGAALVELISYGKAVAGGRLEPNYGAVVLVAGQRPEWVPLGPAPAMNSLIWNYTRGVRGRTSEALAEQALQQLHQAVFSPVEAALPEGTTTLLISPDGPWNFVSFATLLDEEGRFLSERYDVLYVSSGRDLLHSEDKPAPSRAVLLADPEFVDPDVEPLPYARQESQQIALLLLGRKGWSVEQWVGAEASEARVKAVERPRLLHIATHGYFDAGQSSASGEDPMARSGLVLAANPDGGTGAADDGFLTAGEASLLDLTGTSLVILSACDTGLGLAQAGEGVLGLRRGFLKAGARHLLMTLWSVPDQTTAQFMTDFLEQANGLAPPLALARTQRDWLQRLRRERSLTEAVRRVGPFVLNLRGSWDARTGL